MVHIIEKVNSNRFHACLLSSLLTNRNDFSRINGDVSVILEDNDVHLNCKNGFSFSSCYVVRDSDDKKLAYIYFSKVFGNNRESVELWADCSDELVKIAEKVFSDSFNLYKPYSA